VDSLVQRNRLWRRLACAVAALPEPPPAPVLAVDLEAFDANAADLVRRAGGTPVRVASKSLRVPALLDRVLARPGFHGVLAYTLREALWLHERGTTDDLLVGYPTVDRPALGTLLRSPSALAAVTVIVDDVAHLDLVDAARQDGDPTPVRVAIDVDAGLRLGPQLVGPKRSPLHDPEDVVRLAREVLSRDGFRLVGVMTYEGQVAGVPDDVPGHRLRSALVRGLKAASLSELADRRRRVATALAPLVDLELWNAGGSGSIVESAGDPVVTEVSAGSGLLVPTLFDHYRGFTPRPAAYVGLPVTRRPSAEVATVHGGGYIASGPAGDDRVPRPWLPPGLHLTGLEGAGEVQTPLTGHPAATLAIGDLVWFRHAKSGEPFEHGTRVHLLAGDRFVDVVPTYRGEGQAW
jgi:D-serine deaminase-like pyridoxal phosphate-dependent protein